MVNIFFVLGPGSGKIWWLKKVQFLQKRYHSQWTLLRRKQPKCTSHNFGDFSQPLEFAPTSRLRVVPTEFQVRSVLGVSKAKVISIQAPRYQQSALIRSCNFEYERGSNLGHELDQGPTRRVPTSEPSAGHKHRPSFTQLTKNTTADVQHVFFFLKKKSES